MLSIRIQQKEISKQYLVDRLQELNRDVIIWDLEKDN